MNATATLSHEPDPATYSCGGAMARCLHCGQRIMWAGIHGQQVDVAWRVTDTTTACDGTTR